MNKVIDSFHVQKVNRECHTSFSSQGLKEMHPDANTQADKKQTFVWMAQYKNKTLHLFDDDLQ